MTTPVTTSELFTLTGVLSCANACSAARMTKAAVNTANREMVLFISASHNAKTLQAHSIFSDLGGPLSVISDQMSVLSDHGQAAVESHLRFRVPVGRSRLAARGESLLRIRARLQACRKSHVMNAPSGAGSWRQSFTTGC